MKTTITPEELDCLFPQAVGWMAKVEAVKRQMTPARAKKLQERIDAAVEAKLEAASKAAA